MSLIEAIARRFDELTSRTQTDGRLTFLESLAVAQTESDGDEMTRAGRRFHIGLINAVTGIAPVQAIPTTAAQWAFYNADPKKTYFFDMLGAYVVSGTAGAGIVLLATVFGAPLVGATAMNAKLLALNASGSSIGSKAIIAASVTITSPAAPGWFPVAECDSGNTAVGSVHCRNRDLRGRLALQPGQALGLAVVSPAGTTPLYAPTATWSERATDTE